MHKNIIQFVCALHCIGKRAHYGPEWAHMGSYGPTLHNPNVWAHLRTVAAVLQSTNSRWDEPLIFVACIRKLR